MNNAMSEAIAMGEADGLTSITRAEWLQLRKYWREKDGKTDSSAARRRRNQHRRGRPRKAKDQRTHPWTLYLSALDCRLLRKAAKSAGLKPSDWLKTLIHTAS